MLYPPLLVVEQEAIVVTKTNLWVDVRLDRKPICTARN